MHLLQAGINLVYIRDILGHVSVQTTEVYAKADSLQKREALEKNYIKLIPETETTRQFAGMVKELWQVIIERMSVW